MGQHHGAPSHTGSLEESGAWSFSGQAGMWERGLGVSEVLLGCVQCTRLWAFWQERSISALLGDMGTGNLHSCWLSTLMQGIPGL